jgi:hypothetical protein
MKSRPLSVETLMLALGQTPEYKHMKAAEVKYHRDCLLDAKLLRSNPCQPPMTIEGSKRSPRPSSDCARNEAVGQRPLP